MRSGFVILTSLALGALLVGCGEPEAIVNETETVPVDEDVPTPEDLAEVPPTDEDIVSSEEGNVWAEHMGDVPWVFGAEKGLAQAKAEGKPILFFYTATW